MAVSASGAGRNADLHLQETKLWREQRETSPERTVVWSEPVNNGGKAKRVPVLYYLSRNGHLEHPHFIEVPLSSQGLLLRDVLNRLNVLRGKGMASMYSWSCKRNYKNGFVWHDLSENDLICPAHGHEYVLKGSELPQNSFLDISSPSPWQQPTPHQPPPQPESRRIGGDRIVSPAGSGNRRRRNKSCSSIDIQYNVYKAETSPVSYATADVSTQTDDTRRGRPLPEIVEEENCKEPHPDEIVISPPHSDSGPETLQTLLKADGRPTLRPETALEHPTAANIHHNHRQQIQRCRSSVLMQLISCSALPFKDCVAGQGMALIGQYKTRVSRGRGTAENGRGKREEKEYFSGSLVLTKKEEFLPALKRSTSYNAARSPHLELLEKEIKGVRAKCIPRKAQSDVENSSPDQVRPNPNQLESKCVTLVI